MDIYLIRHTEVAVGRGIAYGQSDVALTDNYPEQRDRLLTHLPVAPSVIFTSPLSRCRRLADDLAEALTTGSPIETAPGQTALADAHRPPVQADDRLREFHFGDWELKAWSAIGRDALDAWMADFVRNPTPNGENFDDLSTRVQAFWQDAVVPLLATGEGGPVLVVSHGGVIRALLCLFLDLSLQNAYRIHLDYGAVSRVSLIRTDPTTANPQGLAYTIQYINR